MKVRGPKGAMTYTPNMVRHFGMIAGGTGITPMLQIARAIQRGRAYGDKTKVDLIFANVNEEDILLREDLDKLASEDELFNVHYVLNNPPTSWAGGVGFVTGEMIKVSEDISSKWTNTDQIPGPSASPSQGRQNSRMRSTSDGLRHQEGHRVSGFRKGQARQQAR